MSDGSSDESEEIYVVSLILRYARCNKVWTSFGSASVAVD